jgi:formyltetrahydrofolate-dependent phosphoribosylglycinamide formyltransferase
MSDRPPLRLAVLLSGSGRTLQNFIDLADKGQLPVTLESVISSRPDVYGLTRAHNAGIPTTVVDRRALTAEQFNERLTTAVDAARPDLICMAGFLSLWTIPDRYAGKVMNIHPALLPDFGGKGFFGHHVHQAVLAAGAKTTGCTVHFADNQYDHGPTIIQEAVPVLPNDTPESLATRVFEKELTAYPAAIRLYHANQITLDGKTAHIAAE